MKALILAAAACILLWSGPVARAQDGTIPPPDESHAMHPIGTCGGKHFDPRLQLCDPRDNHLYRIVTIGTQTWMAENLNFGKMIPGSENQTKPGEKYCLYDDAADCAALYQWAEAAALPPEDNSRKANLSGTVQGICPTGWHLPSSAEWNTLIALVDKEQGKSGEAMSLMYYSPNDDFKWKTNTNPDNLLPHDRYGFEVLSTGIRDLKAGCPVGQNNNTYFCNAHDRAFFWTSDDNSTDNDPRTAVDYSFTEDVPVISRDSAASNPLRKCDPARFGVKGCAWKQAQKIYGMSVRCIRNR